MRRTLLPSLLLLPLLVASSARAEQPPCASDVDCPNGTTCSDGKCREIQRRLLAPGYYRSADHRTKIVWPFPLFVYAQRNPLPGETGFRFLAWPPLYGHWWSKEGKGKIVFPFYWRFQSYRARTTTTVVPPVVWRDFADKGGALGVLPLFYASRFEQHRKLLIPPLLSFWRSDDGRGLRQGLITPLYYFRREKDAATDISPLFARTSSKESAFAWAFPLNFYWRSGARSNLLGLPLVWERKDAGSGAFFWLLPPTVYSHGKDESFFTLFPIFWRTTHKQWSFTLLPPIFHRGRPKGYLAGVFPLLWLGKDDDRRQAVLFPVFWRFSGKTGGTTVALTFYRRWRNDRSAVGLLPIFYAGEDRKAGTSYQLLLPLFWRSTRDHDKRAKIISPVFAWERDDVTRVRQWGLLAPPYYHRRDPVRAVDALFPLFLRWRNYDEGTTTWALGPFVHHDDPDEKGFAAVPLLVRFTEKRSGAHGGLVGPVYWSRGPNHSATALFPLLFHSRTGSRSAAVLFPIFWRFADRNGSSTLAGLFYHHRDRQGWYAGLAPLVLLQDHGGVSHQIVPPLFAHLRDARERSETWFFFPFYRTTRPSGHATGVLPLFFAGRDGPRGYLAMPLLLFARTTDASRNAGSLWIGPYYGWREGCLSPSDGTCDDSGDNVFPIFFRSQRFTKSGVRTSLTIFPVYHFTSDPRREVLVSPLGGYARDFARKTEWGAWGPYVWHRAPGRGGFAIVPLFAHYRDARDQSETTVLPLFVSYRAPGRRTLVVLPSFWWLREPGETNLAVFPFYFRIRTGDPKKDDVDVAFPLVWSYRSSARRLLIAGPYYRRTTPESASWSFLPLLYSSRDRKGRTFVGFPLYWDFDDFVKQRRSIYAGPVYSRQYADGWGFGVFPLLFLSRRTESSHTVVFPLFWRFTDARAKTATTVFGPIFRRRDGARAGFGLLPFFWTFGDPSGERSVTVLPLFHVKTNPTATRVWTLPFGIGRSVERSYDWVTPLYWRSIDRAAKTTTLVLPPLLYYGNWGPTGRTDSALLVFFHQKRIEGRTVVAFPLLWHFDDYHDTATTLLVPLWLRYRVHRDDTTTHLFPWLMWLRTHPQGTDLVVLPLFYRFAKRDSAVAVLFPLYWDFKGRDRRTTVAFPLLVRVDRPDSDTWLVLNTWLRFFKREGGYQLIVFPLFEWARIRPKDLRVELFFGLVGYERIGRSRFVKLFWFFDVPIAPPSRDEAAWLGSERRSWMLSR
ncbi:MAG: hypothetical protein AABZ30_09070 [Myxococcota bacterium]